MPPEKAARGSSSSLFNCDAIAECAFPIDSVSPRTTSSDARSVPASQEPSDLRHRERSFREYSSSIAARAVLFGLDFFENSHVFERILL